MTSFLGLAQAIQKALKGLQLYGGAHPRSREALEELAQTLDAALARSAQIHLATRNGRLYVDKQMADATNLHVKALGGLLEERQIASLVILRGATVPELESFLEVLITKPARLQEMGGARQVLEAKRLPHIRIQTARLEEVSGGSAPDGEDGEGGGGDGGSGTSPGFGISLVGGGGDGDSSGSGSGSGAAEPMDAATYLRTLLSDFVPAPAGGFGAADLSGLASVLAGAGLDPAALGATGTGGMGAAGAGGMGAAGAGGSGAAGAGGSGAPGAGGPGAAGAGGMGAPGAGAGGAGAGDMDAAGAGGAGAAGAEALGSGGAGAGGSGAEGVGPGSPGAGGAGAEGPGPGGIAPAGLGEGFRRLLEGLEPAQRVALLRGVAALPEGPVREQLIQAGLPFLPPSLAGAYSLGLASPAAFAGVVQELLAVSPNPSFLLSQLMEELLRHGLNERQIQELMDLTMWDTLDLGARAAKLMEGDRIFDMPREKVLATLRELLEGDLHSEFLNLTLKLAEGLAAPAVARRAWTAETFADVADWVDMPGIPPFCLDPIQDVLVDHYRRERDPDPLGWSSLAIEHLAWHWVESGAPQRMEALLADLADSGRQGEAVPAWKAEATAAFRGRLARPERMGRLLESLFTVDREMVAIAVHPILAALGQPAAEFLTDHLAGEQDRMRRGRLLEALKACGETAEGPLLESLQAQEWFVVRNALVVLAEVGGAGIYEQVVPYLRHREPRVVRAAIRAAWRLGGRQAEAPLAALLGQGDPETQMEALFCLGDLKAKGAVPALVELSKGSRWRQQGSPAHERLRERMVEVLGLIGSPTAVPALEELAQRKRGFFGSSSEPPRIRQAAMKALLALGAPEARAAFDRVLKAEPKGQDREAFERLQGHP